MTENLAESLPTTAFTFDPAAVFDTATHAATSALVAAGRVCPDPVRAQSARQLITILGDCAAGDGGPARRRASVIATLFHDSAGASPQLLALLLAAERWMMHPAPATAAELLEAARAFTDSAPAELTAAAWAAGAGLDAAVAEVVTLGAPSASEEAIALIAGVLGDVPLVLIAQRCGVSRDALHRRLRAMPADPVPATRC